MSITVLSKIFISVFKWFWMNTKYWIHFRNSELIYPSIDILEMYNIRIVFLVSTNSQYIEWNHLIKTYKFKYPFQAKNNALMNKEISYGHFRRKLRLWLKSRWTNSTDLHRMYGWSFTYWRTHLYSRMA